MSYERGERVRFVRELSFTRRDQSRTLLAPQGATATVLGTYWHSGTPAMLVVEMDQPEYAEKVEVRENYLEPE